MGNGADVVAGGIPPGVACWRATARWTFAGVAMAVALGMPCLALAVENGAPKPGSNATSPLPGGFPATGLTIARDEIIVGGPGPDGIRGIDRPKLVLPDAATRWVRDEHTVIGVSLGGDARAYPLHVLEHHQIVNDRFGDAGVVVAYDPLIDVARAYHTGPSPPGNEGRMFGVSGLVYRCNFLLHERGDRSLWTQYEGLALSGGRAGQRLEPISVRVEPLGVWRKRHPATLVLEPPEGRRIDYRYSLYTSYWVSDKIPFPVEHVDSRIHPKELVLGARVGDVTRAYLAGVVERRGGRIVDEIAGHRLRVQYDSDSGTFSWEAPDAVDLTSAYWFAWKNFNPATELWNVSLEPAGKQVEAPTGAAQP